MKFFPRKVLLGLIPGLLAIVASPSAGMAEIQARTMRISIGVAADHPIGQGLQRLSEVVAAKSGGKMQVKPYYSGTLGDDAKATSALQGGIQEMTVVSTAPLAGNVRELRVFDLPFLFNSYQEVDAVLDGPFGRKLLDKLPEKELIGLCYWENGFRHATNSRHPIVQAEDFGGLKFRTMQSPIYIDAFNRLGANATPMAFSEVYTALETGAIDGQENPIATIDTSKFDEVQEYLSLTKHSYSPLAVLVSKKFWDKLDSDERTILQESCVEVRDYQRKLNRDTEERILTQLKEKGMQVNAPAPSELERMRETIKPVMDEHVKSIGADLVNELYAEIAKVRQQ